jgi:chaperonin cofactor prefoldin
MRTEIEKLAEDLASIEKYNDELEQLRNSEPIRSHYGMTDYDDDYKQGILACRADDIDNVNETITSFKDVLEATELMSKEEFKAIDNALTSFMARMENLK